MGRCRRWPWSQGGQCWGLPRSIVRKSVPPLASFTVHQGTYLRESTVVPEVALVGEAVADESELALLGVLLDGVESLLLGDLGSS